MRDQTSKNKILIVDDEPAILDHLSAFLKRSGFDVEQAQNGMVALEAIQRYQPDVIVLDVMMPVLDGREMLRRLRAEDNWTPVILLTEVGNATERAMAITEGADDYLNKPYDAHELIARIQSLLRRSQQQKTALNQSDSLTSGLLKLNRHARLATVGNHKLTLTPRAMHLLEFLMLHPQQLLSRERLLNAVWGWDFATGTRSVDARIVEIRKAIAEHSEQTFIETVPGEGYRFVEMVK